MQWFDDCDFFPKDYERNFQDFFDFEVSKMQTWFSRVWHDRDLSGSFLLPPRDPGRSAGCCAGPGDRPAGQGLHRLGHPDSQNTQPSSILQHGRQAAEIFHLWSVEHKLMRNNRLFQGLTPASPTSLYSNQVKWSLKQFSLNFFPLYKDDGGFPDPPSYSQVWTLWTFRIRKKDLLWRFSPLTIFKIVSRSHLQ